MEFLTTELCGELQPNSNQIHETVIVALTGCNRDIICYIV